MPFVLIGNFLWRNKVWQNSILFLASLIFYAWGEGPMVIILIVSILVNYLLGLLIDKSRSASLRKRWLVAGIVLNLGTLIYFKYTEFFVGAINDLLSLINLNPIELTDFPDLPIGISFYTFQSLSYLVDVSRRHVKAQKSFINLGLYISLFPQLIAGPIVRYQEIDKQLLGRSFKIENFNKGIRRFIIGLGKKVIIADSIAYVVDQIFALEMSNLSTPLAWFAAIGYGIQIYFDFSGYSDMAIGLGRMFGFKFPENFNYPFRAVSIKDFWRKWHITLSVWFRDYLYFPMGGNRKGKYRTLINLFTVFFVVGLWHGASWNYVNYGLYMGIFIVLEKHYFDKFLVKLPRVVQTIYMLFLINIGWVIFRLEDSSMLNEFLSIMFSPSVSENQYTIAMFTNSYQLVILFIGAVLSFPVLEHFKINKLIHRIPFVDWLVYSVIFTYSIFEIINSVYSPFIYFRF